MLLEFPSPAPRSSDPGSNTVHRADEDILRDIRGKESITDGGRSVK